MLFSLVASGQDRSPRLLLTPQRLKRLQRDSERRTVRWVNFANRVQSVPDSPERGFELALYYAITHDEERGRQAVQWARAHPCDRRQVALIRDWCGPLLSDENQTQPGSSGCAAQPGGLDEAASSRYLSVWKPLLAALQTGGFRDARRLYAAVEFVDAVRSTHHVDLREDDPRFFSVLPTEFLLSLKPNQVEHPDWRTHIAALALVTLDPNLEGSQYLQGWAMEERQMLQNGPGVAYELLWADPYLPGIGYQNLDPWVYDSHGRLFARTDWTPSSCWIAISTQGVDEENCPAGWREKPASFGRMTLLPMASPCTEAPVPKGNRSAILWRVQPHQNLSYRDGKQRILASADAAGLWRIPRNIQGKICPAPEQKH